MCRLQERANRVRLFDDPNDESDSDDDEDVVEGEAYEWFQDWVHSPHTLMQLCRIALRSYIGKHIIRKADDLPLPKPVIDYVTLKEVEDHPLHGTLM